jgi:hypothetical protein
MEEGKPSVSAIMCAILRAEYLLWNDQPKIFEDSLALRLSGFESDAALRRSSATHFRALYARAGRPPL